MCCCERLKGITSSRSTSPHCTFTMSSFVDLHCTKAETSVTAPFISMETILTGMATVRPVRIAVLIISVSYGEKKKHSWNCERQKVIFPDISSPWLMFTFKAIIITGPFARRVTLSAEPKLHSVGWNLSSCNLNQLIFSFCEHVFHRWANGSNKNERKRQVIPL